MGSVFNLEVEDVHCFFANGILTHNCDDPQNALEAYSSSARRHTLEWFGDVWSNRMNDPKRAVMLVIQQRIHEDDLSGNLMKREDWVHLKLPMQYEGEKNRTILGWEDPRTEEGEFLNPERFGPDERKVVVQGADEIGYATQFQQRPSAKGGTILRDKAWVRYRRSDLPEKFLRVGAFADTASKAKESNDFSAIALWGENEDGWWLLDLKWGKWEFPELEEQAKEAWDHWRDLPAGRRPTVFVIEDASSGTQLVQQMTRFTKIPVIGYSAGGDKEFRVNMVAPYQWNGKFHIPATDTDGLGVFDVKDFLTEHSMFPRAAHDDRVDTTTSMMFFWVIAPPERKEKGAYVATGKSRGEW